VPSLQDLANNLANYQYYSGRGTFNANKLPYGKDTVGGGDSIQPFIVRKIGERWSPSNFNDTMTQFGAITTITRTVADVVRIAGFMTTGQGVLFNLKQIGLQRMNPNVFSKPGIYDTKIIDTQKYNPLNTLAQVGIAGSGFHLKKHGLLPGYSDPNYYEKQIKSIEDKGDNRLFLLSKHLSQPEPLAFMSKYSGGPGSFYGIGSTTATNNRLNQFYLSETYIRGNTARSSKQINQGFIAMSNGELNGIKGDSETGYTYVYKLKAGVATTIDGTLTSSTGLALIDLRTQDFRILKNSIKDNQLKNSNNYYTLPTSDYPKYNIEKRIGVARVRRPEQRVNYTGSADTSDRLNAISLYYSNSPVVENRTILDINDKEVNAETIRDIIKFRIKILDNDRPSHGVYIVFRAYISNIRRNVTSKWDAYKYVGRGESFYAYDGFTETITYSFTIAASSREEMKPLYQKLNYLIASMTPDYRANLMRGNIAELTIGDFLLYQPGIITNFDMNIDEDSNWEIALQEPEGGLAGTDTDMHELPQLIKCNMTFIPIYNFLPKKSSEAPFIGIDDKYEKKPGKMWLKDTASKIKEQRLKPQTT
jgi:hypothetical protein